MSVYTPRDPHAKLREIVANWTLSMRTAGRVPNCGVVFGPAEPRHARPQAHAWLVGDRRPETRGDRYVIMDDGDVWRARSAPSPEDPGSWMTAPDDDLVTLLSRSLGDARLGGAGWLELDGQAAHVADRRRESGTHRGQERRRA